MPEERSIYQVMLKLLNTPLMIHADTLDVMLGIIHAKSGIHLPVAQPAAALSLPFDLVKPPPPPSDGIAVIPVYGYLSYHSDPIMDWLFGDSSYEDIRASLFAALMDTSVKAVVLDCDSCGGEVQGCMDLVDDIYQARGSKPIYASVNETAFSGAYAIASAADKIYISRTGGAGSIGVIMRHMDQSRFDEKEGVKFTAIYAGSRKNDYDSHTPLSAEAFAAATELVNSTYDLFVKTVARNRGMTPAAVQGTEAALFYGDKAIAAGLVDAVMPWNRAMTEIMKKNSQKGGMRMFKDDLSALIATAKAEEIPEALAALGYMQKEAATETAPDVEGIKIAAVSETRTALLEQIQGVMDVCVIGGMPQMIPAIVRDGLTVEAAKEKVLAEKARETDRSNIRSTVGALSTGEVNPLLADAGKRAAEAAKR